MLNRGAGGVSHPINPHRTAPSDLFVIYTSSLIVFLNVVTEQVKKNMARGRRTKSDTKTNRKNKKAKKGSIY